MGVAPLEGVLTGRFFCMLGGSSERRCNGQQPATLRCRSAKGVSDPGGDACAFVSA